MAPNLGGGMVLEETFDAGDASSSLWEVVKGG